LVSGGAKVAITNINQGLLQQIQFPVPPEEEQRKIADTIELVDGKIAFHRRKQDLLYELFKTLLNQMLTGNVRVKDLDLSSSLRD
jgi:type I restriction enzyme S subunit